ncbi:hypothetical protein LY623_00875 [Halomonas sp. M5N1S15]|nr:hypothetical protein [Halomonas alkalisoli]
MIGAPNGERGQIVEAFVVLSPEIEPDATCVQRLQDFVKQTLAPYKSPRSIRFVEELPKTATGKIQRFRLRQEHYPSDG